MVLKVLNIIFFAVMIYLNYLANSLPINAQTTGEVSNAYANLFTPAGITFSIWGIIYLLLGIISVLLFKSSNEEVLQSVSWLFIISSLFNSAWILAWHYEKFGLSVLIMILLLITLIYINQRISAQPQSIFKVGFGIYLGWICIATIANITVWLVSMNWSGIGISEEIWAALLVVIGLGITIVAVYKFRNPFIAISVIWAFIGIAIKRSGNSSIVFISAIMAAIFLTGIMVFYFAKKPISSI